MIELTREQEKEILKQVPYCKFIGNGASRIVVECPQDICDEYCGGNPAVIKVAIGLGGINQMNLEVDTYISYGEYYNLATIYASGLCVEIMEKMSHTYEVCDFLEWDNEDEYATEDAINTFMGWFDVSEEIAADLFNVAYSLCDIFGYTNDNGQLGVNGDGRVVAYDYGFESNSDSTQTCDLIYELVYHDDNWEKYLELVRNNIDDADSGDFTKIIQDCEYKLYHYIDIKESALVI